MKTLFLFVALVIVSAWARPAIKRRGPVPFIVGGTESSKGRWPWQLSMHRRGDMGYSHGCGAVLVSATWALTAAHCFLFSSVPSDYQLHLGAHRILPDSDAEQILETTRIIEHPSFDLTEPGLPHDIALMEMTGSANTANPNIATVALPDDGKTYAGDPNCWITGWGRTSADAEGASPVLMELNIPVLTNQVCSDRWRQAPIIGEIHPILDQHICVGDDAGQQSACQGDSGGPLSCNDQGTWVVAGVTSRGWPDCHTYPSVYTRVSRYNAWIRSHIG